MTRQRTRTGWRGAEIRHFLTLSAIEETGSFRAAAARRGYVPSAVSQQIAELERIVGGPLVERSRGRRPVQLTPAGRLLADHGRRLGAAVDAVRADLAAVERDAGTTTIAVSGVLARSTLPRLAARLAGRDVEIVETEDDEQPLALLRRGAVDLAVGAFPAPSPALEARSLGADPYVLLVPQDSALGAAEQVTPHRLADEPLLVPPGWGSVEAHLEALGIGPATRRRAPAWELAALVAGGAGVAVASASMRWPDERRVRRVDARPLLGARGMALLSRRRRAQPGSRGDV